MYWINFLHIYQPPWQDNRVIKKIADESYRYILDILKKNKSAKITLNICGSLTEQLVNLKYFDIIKNIKKLVRNGQIELTGTAMYHAFLPRLPKKEVIRQIQLNENYQQKVFGKEVFLASQKKLGKRGFFIPEMAYSKRVTEIVSDLGFDWIILDEIALGGNLGNVDWQKRYFIKSLKKLGVVFRNRKIYRKSFTGKTFDTLQILEMAKKERFVVTARDGESYHDEVWNKKKDRTLKKILKSKRIKTLTVSEYLSQLDKEKSEKKFVNPLASSWESLESELAQNKSFEIWKSKENPIHQKIWRLINLTIGIINQNKKDENFTWARRHLDRGLASCGLWWADGRFKGYNPEEIEKNALELIKAVRSLKNLSKKTKVYFEQIYSHLIYSIWQRHWEKI